MHANRLRSSESHSTSSFLLYAGVIFGASAASAYCITRLKRNARLLQPQATKAGRSEPIADDDQGLLLVLQHMPAPLLQVMPLCSPSRFKSLDLKVVDSLDFISRNLSVLQNITVSKLSGS